MTMKALPPEPQSELFPPAEPIPLSTDGGVAEIAVGVAVGNAYSYHYTAEQAPRLAEGVCVSVPFRGKPTAGVILALRGAKPGERKLADLLEVLDSAPLIDRRHLDFLRAVARQTFTPLGEVLRAAIPAPMRETGVKGFRLAVPPQELVAMLPAKKKLPRAFAGREVLTERELKRAGLDAVGLRELLRLKVLAPAYRFKREKARRWVQILVPAADLSLEALPPRAKKQRQLAEWILRQGRIDRRSLLEAVRGGEGALAALLRQKKIQVEKLAESDHGLATLDHLPPTPRVALTSEQTQAVAAMTAALAAGAPSRFLLHGITGSGKTEVYMQVIEAVLAAGRNAMTLVPEIALTPQLIHRYRSRFGPELAVFHSGLGDADRLEQWRKIRQGRCRILVGVRSAILTPMQKLGVIVVDEEHEPSYKQDDRFLYHARALAEQRAREERALLILGSATPSLESRAACEEGGMQRLVLSARPTGQDLPQVKIVDMKREPLYFGQRLVISRELRREIGLRLQRGEQTILFLNRRGFFAYLLCVDCGAGLSCPNCSVSLTIHRAEDLARCHYCDHRGPIPRTCPSCGREKLVPMGFGTQQLEEEVERFFPDARLLRMDRDSTQGKMAHERMIRRLERREVDILIGTQMVAKGLDIPTVTLVGVILADQSLHFPDFRSSERTFQLLTQVAGRSGRGQEKGEVLIQTYSPDHPSITLAARQDYDSFYRSELEHRRQQGYPPFTHLAMLRCSAVSERRLLAAMDKLRPLAKAAAAADAAAAVLGPAPAPLVKMANRFRWQMLFKHPQAEALAELCRALEAAFSPVARELGVRYKVDINPYQFM